MTIATAHPEAIRHDPFVFEPWILQPQIDERVGELAGHLALRFAGEKVRLLTVLNGAQPFASLLRSKLVRTPGGPSTVFSDTVRAKSYAGTSSGELQWLKDPNLPTRPDVHDVVLEDIADSGRTISHVAHELEGRGPASLSTVVLLDRPEARRVEFEPDAAGFEIANPDAWAIGFGLDLDEAYRTEPHIYGRVVDGQLPPAYSVPELTLR